MAMFNSYVSLPEGTEASPILGCYPMLQVSLGKLENIMTQKHKILSSENPMHVYVLHVTMYIYIHTYVTPSKHLQ